MLLDRQLRLFALVVAALAAAAGITVIVADSDNNGRPDTITIHIDSGDANTKRDNTVTLTPQAEDTLDAAKNAYSEDPVGDLQSDSLREPTDTSKAGILEGPQAAQEFPGCRTRFVGNFSSRRGQTPQIIAWHQTVSRERGWDSQDGLTAYANSPSSGVSWHLLIGRSQGRCTFSVPLNMKAWTQGNANPFAIGIEVEAMGDEPSYVTGAGERKLLAVTRELGRRFNIPMRHGKVINCRVVISGIVEHSELGACGGGHSDVTPWSTAPLIKKLAPAKITRTDIVTCRKLNWWRAHDRPQGLPQRRASRRRAALDKRGVTCTSSGPVRR